MSLSVILCPYSVIMNSVPLTCYHAPYPWLYVLSFLHVSLLMYTYMYICSCIYTKQYTQTDIAVTHFSLASFHVNEKTTNPLIARFLLAGGRQLPCILQTITANQDAFTQGNLCTEESSNVVNFVCWQFSRVREQYCIRVYSQSTIQSVNKNIFLWF